MARGDGVFQWDTTDVMPDDYYIYGVIQDANDASDFSKYSLGKITIADPQDPARVIDLSAKWLGDDRVELSWTPVPVADRYSIRYSDDAAGATLPEDVRALSIDGTTIVGDLTPGETYRFTITPLRTVDNGPEEDATLLVGQDSLPAIAVVGPLATVAPIDDQWLVFADPGTAYSELVSFEAGQTLTLVQAPDGARLTQRPARLRGPFRKMRSASPK